jgi:propanol-preferring alcohol dehydrogenase
MILHVDMTRGRVGGHEGVGKVVKLGAGVTQVKEGDIVGSKWISSCCESCELCLAGRDAFCPNAAVNGGTVDGTFQQYAVQPASYVTPIPNGLAPENAVGLSAFSDLC